MAENTKCLNIINYPPLLKIRDKMQKQSFTNKTKKGKNIQFTIILILCITFLLSHNPAMAFPENTDNANNTSVVNSTDQSEVSEFSHLIELYFEDNNYILAGESVVYSTNKENVSDQLVMWVPENAEIMQFFATDMMESGSTVSINYSRQNGVLYFNRPGNLTSGGMPLLYKIRYVVHSHEEIPTFNKVISEEGPLDHQVSRLILLINHQKDQVPVITSADGSPIKADDTANEDNKTSYIWSSPQFSEFSVALQKNSYPQTSGTSFGSFMIPGIIVLIIITVAIMYYRSQRNGDLKELEDIYEAEMEVISRIKEDRKNNRLSKDEYESVLKKHTDNVSKIKRKMEKQKKN